MSQPFYHVPFHQGISRHQEANQMTKNLKKDNPQLYRARALRQAYKKLGHDLPVPEILKLMEASAICPYCDKPIPPLDFSIDHITPKQKGGSNAMENLHLI